MFSPDRLRPSLSNEQRKVCPYTPHMFYKSIETINLPASLCLSELQEELEILEAIYIHELQVVKNDREEVSSIILQLYPATGDDDDKKFVCMTLQLDPSECYPDELPEISIRNPRGIGDEEIQSLLEAMHKLANERRGGPMLYELIELAKDSLTVGNIPRCLCMICLEHFFEGELFTRTDCYHYFHKSCLARYVQHFLSNSTEPETKKLTLHMNQEQRKVQCPVCREEMSYEADTLTYSPVEEKVFFQPTQEMRMMQTKMVAMLEKQRAAGGLIDVDAEKNKFLVKDDDVIQLPAKQVEIIVEKKRSDGNRRNDRYSAGRRKRGDNYRGDRSDYSHRRWEEKRDKKEYYNCRGDDKEDFKRAGSGFVRGKGRGRYIEDKRDKKLDDKNSDDTKQNNRDKHKDEVEKNVAVDPKLEGLRDSDGNLIKTDTSLNTKAENKVRKEQTKELNKPRYDEKINDRHKEGNERYYNQRYKKDLERSPRNSSHGKKGNVHETDGENVGFQIQIEKFKDTSKETSDVQRESIDKEGKNCNESKTKSAFENSAEPLQDNHSHQDLKKENDDKVKSEELVLKNNESKEDTKNRKPGSGFGKPRDKRWDENEQKTVSQRFGKQDYNRRDHGHSERPQSGFNRKRDKRDGEHEQKRSCGGFGKPESDWKVSNRSKQPHSGFDKPSNRKVGENETKRTSDSNWENNDERDSSHSSFGKPVEKTGNRPESKKQHEGFGTPDSNWRDNDKKDRPHSDFGKPADRTIDGHERKRHRGGFGLPDSNWRDKSKSESLKSGFGKRSDEIVHEGERKKPSGGFGKPDYKNEDYDKSGRRQLGFEKRNDRFNNDRKDKSYSRNESYRRSMEEDFESQRTNTGFGRPNTSHKFSDKKIQHAAERQSSKSDKMERSDWKSDGSRSYESKGRVEKSYRKEKCFDDFNEKSTYWDEEEIERRSIERHSDNKNNSSLRNDRDMFDDNVRAINDKNRTGNTHVLNDYPNVDGIENTSKLDCDNKSKTDSVQTSHPPGFRIGPPPGFKQNSKGSEAFLKPPPGF